MKRPFHAENLKNGQANLHIRFLQIGFVHIVKVGIVWVVETTIIDVFEVLDVVIINIVVVLVEGRKRIRQREAEVVVRMPAGYIVMILVILVMFVVIVVEVIVVVVGHRVVRDVEVEVKLLQIRN